MGHWRITIDGTGCHHNSNPTIDADIATREFVRELKKQGHTIHAARFEARGVYKWDEVDPNAPMNIDFLKVLANDAANGT